MADRLKARVPGKAVHFRISYWYRFKGEARANKALETEWGALFKTY